HVTGVQTCALPIYWFVSPFSRTESKPSFSYKSRLNTFYAYGNGVSGTVVDYIRAYYQCDIPKALDLLKDFNFSFSQQITSNEIVAEKKKNNNKEKRSTSFGVITNLP